LYDRTTAVSLRHADYSRLYTRLQQQHSSSNTYSTCENLDLDLVILYPAYIYINYNILKKDKDVLGRTRD